MRLHDDATVARYTERGWWGGPGWSDWLSRWAAERPDRTALVDPLDRSALVDGASQRLTWAQLDTVVNRWVTALYNAGVRHDDIVAIQLPNVRELPIALLACDRVGAIASPMPVQYREHELGQLAAATKARHVITASTVLGRNQVELVRHVQDQLGLLEHVLLIDGPLSMDQIPDPDPNLLTSLPARDPNDAVTICWTSGTESTPKGVPRCTNDWSGIALATRDAARMTGDDVMLCPFPMVNMGGIGGMFVGWLETGAQLVLHHPFQLELFLQQIVDERVSYSAAAPSLLTMLLQDDELLSKTDLTSLRCIGSGSAPLSSWMIRTWADRFGVEIINMFGSNEGTVLIGDERTVPDPEVRAVCFPWFGGPNLEWSNGVAAQIETKLVDPSTGLEVTEPGHPAELWTRGATVIAGYLNGAGSSSFEDGWYRSGDLFEIADEPGEEHRYLRFVDRAKDLIIRGGMNVSPAELEGMLITHPAVTDVAVVGYPDEVLGEKIAAVVVAAPDRAAPTLGDLIEHLRQSRLASFKLPERIEIVDALPRNPVGKILKRELREKMEASS